MLNLHPKVKWAALLGAVSTSAFAILGAVGLDVPQGVAAAITALVASVAGYLKSS